MVTTYVEGALQTMRWLIAAGVLTDDGLLQVRDQAARAVCDDRLDSQTRATAEWVRDQVDAELAFRDRECAS